MDDEILACWDRHVTQWTAAVRNEGIESRRTLTNQAIVDTVLSYAPESLLDIGCGEGWLIRALSSKVERLVGVDGIPGLIEQARAAGGGDFLVATYEAIAQGVIEDDFDTVVCNFSLLGKDSVEALFGAVDGLLKADGKFLVQTLHPLTAGGDLPYRDGWRKGSWAGFNSDFVDPAPWYFRTIESWVKLFSEHGFRLLEIREPMHPQTGQPGSIIFVVSLDAEQISSL